MPMWVTGWQKGAELARLDSRKQQAQVARAKAAVEQSEANLQKAMARVWTHNLIQ